MLGRLLRPGAAVDLARVYFAGQALAGAAWWVLVFTLDSVREVTLGGLSAAALVGPDLVLFVGASALAAITGRVVWAVVTTGWTAFVAVSLTIYGLVEREAGWGVVAMAVALAGSLVATVTLRLGRFPAEYAFVGPFRFREASGGEEAPHFRRSLIQLVVFWVTFLGMLPIVLVAGERRLRLDASALGGPGLRIAGVVLFLASSALGLWSCRTMAIQGLGTPLPASTAQRLVVAGPYRWVRNPMAVAGAGQTTGVGLMWRSSMVIAAAVVASVLWNEVVRPAEEADLRRRFGDEFDEYRRRVRCWMPSRPAD